MLRKFFFAAAAAVLVATVVPEPVEAQCGICEWRRGRYHCSGPGDNPPFPPYCAGTWWFGMACFSCSDDDGMAAAPDHAKLNETTRFALDGSMLESRELSEFIRSDPSAGWRNVNDTGSVVFFPCTEAIAGRVYDQSAVDKLKRRSAVIRI